MAGGVPERRLRRLLGPWRRASRTSEGYVTPPKACGTLMPVSAQRGRMMNFRRLLTGAGALFFAVALTTGGASGQRRSPITARPPPPRPRPNRTPRSRRPRRSSPSRSPVPSTPSRSTPPPMAACLLLQLLGQEGEVHAVPPAEGEALHQGHIAVGVGRRRGPHLCRGALLAGGHHHLQVDGQGPQEEVQQRAAVLGSPLTDVGAPDRSVLASAGSSSASWTRPAPAVPSTGL